MSPPLRGDFRNTYWLGGSTIWVTSKLRLAHAPWNKHLKYAPALMVDAALPFTSQLYGEKKREGSPGATRSGGDKTARAAPAAAARTDAA